MWNGIVNSVGKTRGRKKAFQWIADRIRNEEPIDTDHMVLFGHSNAPDALAECRAAFAGLAPGVESAPDSPIGAVVGTHVGPGAAGMAYIRKL